MELLQEIEGRGYPSDYLFSRIRGKRVQLVTDWEYLISLPGPLEYRAKGYYGSSGIADGPDGIWQRLMKEFQWVYNGMNNALLRIFRPFFTYAELRTLFISLRYIKGREQNKVRRLLTLSLLSEKIKKMLVSVGDLTVLIEETGEIFVTLSERFAGLEEIFTEQGLRGVEQRLTDRYLEYSIESAPHPVMKDFFSHIIDARNVLSLYKYMRLNARNAPSFIRGGSISEKRFIGIRDRKDVSLIVPLIRKVTGMTIGVPGATEIENALYRNITHRLRKVGRDPLSVGLMLDYLWRCSIEARNLSILYHGKDLDRDSLSEEMVQ